MSEEIKGIGMSLVEALKALGRPIETSCKLIESLLGEPFKAGGDLLADHVRYWQWANRVRIMDGVDKKMRSRGTGQRKLDPGFLLPYIEKAGNVSDESLQDAWAKLLVAAIENKSNERVSFVTALQDLSATDVKVLDTMITLGYMEPEERRPAIAEALGLSLDEVEMSMANLGRLGFFSPTHRRLSRFAIYFLRACVSDADSVDLYLGKQKAREPRIVAD